MTAPDEAQRQTRRDALIITEVIPDPFPDIGATKVDERALARWDGTRTIVVLGATTRQLECLVLDDLGVSVQPPRVLNVAVGEVPTSITGDSARSVWVLTQTPSTTRLRALGPDCTPLANWDVGGREAVVGVPKNVLQLLTFGSAGWSLDSVLPDGGLSPVTTRADGTLSRALANQSSWVVAEVAPSSEVRVSVVDPSGAFVAERIHPGLSAGPLELMVTEFMAGVSRSPPAPMLRFPLDGGPAESLVMSTSAFRWTGADNDFAYGLIEVADELRFVRVGRTGAMSISANPALNRDPSLTARQQLLQTSASVSSRYSAGLLFAPEPYDGFSITTQAINLPFTGRTGVDMLRPRANQQTGTRWVQHPTDGGFVWWFDSRQTGAVRFRRYDARLTAQGPIGDAFLDAQAEETRAAPLGEGLLWVRSAPFGVQTALPRGGGGGWDLRDVQDAGQAQSVLTRVAGTTRFSVLAQLVNESTGRVTVVLTRFSPQGAVLGVHRLDGGFVADPWLQLVANPQHIFIHTGDAVVPTGSVWRLDEGGGLATVASLEPPAVLAPARAGFCAAHDRTWVCFDGDGGQSPTGSLVGPVGSATWDYDFPVVCTDELGQRRWWTLGTEADGGATQLTELAGLLCAETAGLAPRNIVYLDTFTTSLSGEPVQRARIRSFRNDDAGALGQELDAGGDAGVDAGAEAGLDAGTDAGGTDRPDAAVDDAGHDASVDAGDDGGSSDASVDDGGGDAKPDAGPDAGPPDATPDAGQDAGVGDAGVGDAGAGDAGALDAGADLPKHFALGCGCGAFDALPLTLMLLSWLWRHQRRSS